MANEGLDDARDQARKDRELELREREVLVKEREVDKAKGWNSPLVLGVLVAALGLIGNLVVALFNNAATQATERARAQSSVMLEAIKTGNTKEACENLVFLVRLKLIDDTSHVITNTCPEGGRGIPVLPAASVARTTNEVFIAVTDDVGHPINGATVRLQDAQGNGDTCTTREEGLCRVPPLPLGDAIQISASKDGFESVTVKRLWTGSTIPIMLRKK
jgi:hypothetical protein